MELAERMDESAEDMTAAEMAPMPKIDTACGVRYCKTIGSTSRVSAIVVAVPLVDTIIREGRSILDQSKNKKG